MKNPFDPGYYTTPELRKFGFRSIGCNVKIARNCTIIGLDSISVGDNVRIDGYCTIIAGDIEIGSYIHIGAGCLLGGRGGIRMGDYSGLSQGVKIYSASDDYSGNWMTNPTLPDGLTGVDVAAVDIGMHAIIGSGSVVLPGTIIGEGVAIGALSLARKRLADWTIYAGNPAKKVNNRSRRACDLEKQIRHFHVPHDKPIIPPTSTSMLPDGHATPVPLARTTSA